MNLLLLKETEITGKTATITGRRAQHVRQILKKNVGDTVRAGIANLGRCEAEITHIDADSAELRLGELTHLTPPRGNVVLALPRPKALSRIVAAIASFGVQRLVLINAWRVEKSYFASPRLTVDRLLEDATLGCEQGAHVWIPEIQIVRSFREFTEDKDAELFPGDHFDKVVLHPYTHATLGNVLSQRELHQADPSRPRQTVLAFGPEGGFIDPELASWDRASYVAARLETGPLKTEVAVAAALGQLALLRPGT